MLSVEPPLSNSWPLQIEFFPFFPCRWHFGRGGKNYGKLNLLVLMSAHKANQLNGEDASWPYLWQFLDNLIEWVNRMQVARLNGDYPDFRGWLC